MVHRFTILFLLFLLFQTISIPVNAQTDAEAEKLMKKAQSIIDNNKSNDDDIYTTGFEDVDEEELLLKIPPKKARVLSAIPKKTLSKSELAAYILDLKNQLLKKIDPSRVQASKSALQTLGSQVDKIQIEAISTWYNGLQQEAMLLLLEATIKDPDDPLLLNNLAAFLNMGGAPQKAIPILQNLLLSFPENPLVLNNIAQSFANLGDADSAMKYINRCLKANPMHASANHTAGVIEAVKGNTDKAETHFTNALKSSQNSQTISSLKKLNPNSKLSNFLKPKFRMPGDFNPFKYQLPAQLEDVSQTKIVQKEHEDFINYLNELIMQYSALMDEEGESGEKILMQKIADVQKDPFSMSDREASLIRPFTKTANLAILHIIPDLASQQQDANNHKKLLEKQIEEIKEKHKKLMEALAADHNAQYEKLPFCGEGRCGGEKLRNEFCEKETKATNTALKEMAAIRRDIQEKLLIAAVNEFELMGYWGYLAGANEGFAKQAYYKAIHGFLGKVQNAAVTQDLPVPCIVLPEVEENKKEQEKTANAFCPFNFTVGFIVGKIKLDCKKFTISGGEAIRFKYEKEFNSGASTISMGIGWGFDPPAIVPGLNAGVSGELTEAIYITFDKDNNISDGGFEFTARLSEEVKGAADNIKITDRVDIVKAGYKIGVISGLNFTGNSLMVLK